MFKKISIILLPLAVLSGCAKRHSEYKLARLTPETAKYCSTQDGLTLMAKKLDKNESYELFSGRKLEHFGLRALHITLCNESAIPCIMHKSSVEHSCPSLKLATHMERSKASLHLAAGLITAPIILISTITATVAIMVAAGPTASPAAITLCQKVIAPACLVAPLVIFGACEWAFFETANHNNTMREKNFRRILPLKKGSVIAPYSMLNTVLLFPLHGPSHVTLEFLHNNTILQFENMEI